MTKPYNDEEFERVRNLIVASSSQDLNRDDTVSPRDWNRLIATVKIEKQKVFHLGNGLEDWKSKYLEAQKEVESLKENRRLWVSEADRYMKERDKAREENAKLKEAQGKLQFFFHEADRNDILQLKLRQAREENERLNQKLLATEGE